MENQETITGPDLEIRTLGATLTRYHPYRKDLMRLRDLVRPEEDQDAINAWADDLFPALSLEEIMLFGAIGREDLGVTDQESRIRAFATVRYVTGRLQDKVFTVQDFVVDAGYRRQGIGTRLMGAIITMAEKMGCELVETVTYGQPFSEAFCNRLGFSGMVLTQPVTVGVEPVWKRTKRLL